MKNEKTKMAVLRIIKKISSAEVERNKHSWPPSCIGIYHQPKRPK